ncbi:MAG: hypothetical protein QOC81_2996 [Thermoanaerobaculia bacterium]|nr:hypothetical protein [Thermoanaerobaculia bacterium]
MAALSLSAAPLFRNPQLVPLGTNTATYVLKGDFDGDHHDDVLVVNSGKELAVLIDNGTGPFASPVVTPMLYVTSLPALGDVNGDGKLDVVVSDWFMHTITVMLGNGDGTFSTGASFTTAATPGSLAIADFNGDHLLDVAMGTNASSSTTNTLTAYFGDGTGHFALGPVTNVSNELIRALTPADMNGDGRIDLVVTGNNATRILIGNNDGTFTAGGTTVPGGVAIADFNHDGRPDLAIADGQTHAWLLEIDFGNGDGTVTKSAQLAVGYESSSIVAADFNGDENPDLLLAGSLGNEVTVLLGNPNGTFSAPMFFIPGNSSGVVVSDFDRDGKLDFLIPDPEISALAYVRGTGDGTFATYRAFHTDSVVPVLWPGLRTGGAVTADMNNDGEPDVVVMQRHPDVLPFDLGVLLNDGTGKLAAPILTDTGKPEWSGIPTFAIADLNHDGNLDAVVLSNYPPSPTAETFLGHGDGTFGPAIPFTVTVFAQPILADFDGDGTPDLFIQVNSGNELRHGNGDGTFGPAITGNGEASDIFVGDLNGDGKPDYIASRGYGTAAYLNDGTGHFTGAPISSEYLVVAGLADFNGDGKLDLLLGGLRVRFGNGDGTFGGPGTFGVTSIPADRAVTADFDGDGKIDVAFGTTIYLGNGDGTFRARVHLRTNGSGTWFNAADMDGNGSLDLVYLSAGDDVDVILTRTTADPTAASSTVLASSNTAPPYGQNVTFTATVSGSAAFLTGAVLFAINGQGATIVPVDKDGKATFVTTFTPGTYTVTATYAGDENYQPSSASTTESVSKVVTAMTLTSNVNPQSLGRTFQAIVSFSPFAPAGPVTLREGANPINVPYVNERFQVNTNTLGIGTHVITADFPGDANFEPASASYTQVVTKPEPPLVIQIPSGILFAGPMAFHAYFNGVTNITGSISFYEGNVLRGTVALTNGIADLTIPFQWGFHYVEARYSGDSTWGPVTKLVSFNTYIGPWGTPLAILATGRDHDLALLWSPIQGAASYTLWRKQSSGAAWQPFVTYSQDVTAAVATMPSGVTWLVAVSATDTNGAASPMSPPDLATSIVFTDPTLTPQVTAMKAQHIIELRTAIGCVRTFAGLSAFAYTNSVVAGHPILASDLQEMRTALAEARAAIGFSSIAFSDSLTPQSTAIRAAHVNELRAGVD